MGTADVQMYEALTPVLSDKNARAFIEALDESVHSKLKVMVKDLATKTELQNVKEELKGDIQGVKEDLRNVKEELKEDNRKLREELKGDIANVRSEMQDMKLELKGDIANVRLEVCGLKGEIMVAIAKQDEKMAAQKEELKGTMYKVIISVGVAQVVAIVAALYAIVKGLI